MSSGTIIQRIGDDNTLTFTFSDINGDPVDITGSTVFFTVKKDLGDSDLEALIALEQTSHITTNSTEIKITNVLSSTLVQGNYYWDTRIKFASGEIATCAIGIYAVYKTITERTS